MKNYREILIEKFIPGREIQVAIMGKNKLGAIELQQRESSMITRQKYI